MLLRVLRAAFQGRSGSGATVQHALTLRSQGELAQATAVLEACTRSAPGDAIAATNLGIVLLEQDRLDEGAKWLQRAIALDARCAAAHYNYATLLRTSGHIADAITHYRAAIEAGDDFPSAREELMHARLEICDWPGAQREADRLHERIRSSRDDDWIRHVSPTTASYLRLPVESIRRVAAYHAGPAAHPATLRSAGADDRIRHGARLRIGYFSRDFRDHPVGHLLRNALGLHDRERFEVHAFSFGPDDGSVYRQDIERSVDHFTDVSALSDDATAAAIQAHGIDVLIDLMGHTTGHRLPVLARRPAPVQLHYLGYPATTGAEYVDGYIGDALITPPALEEQFTEDILRVPHCYMVSDGTDAPRHSSASRDQQGLPDDAVVFCNFANASRITQATFDLWMAVLREVPSSVLWLKGSPSVETNLREAAEARGVESERLLFAARVADKASHLERIGLADLGLDTLGWYNGHTSTADLLWAGVPTLTSPGTTCASRVAASLITAAGLPELVVSDVEHYVRTAVDLARDRSRLRALKAQLISSRSSAPFFDAPLLVRGLEAAYEQAYAAKIRGPAGL